MSPVNIQTDSIKVVAQAARDLITAINRKTARTVEKTPVPLSDFLKLAEFMWIPGKIPTKDGKIHFEPDFLKDCLLTRLKWEQRGVSQGFQTKTPNDSTDLRNFNGIVYTAQSPEIKASLEALEKLTESEFAQAQEQLFDILKQFIRDPAQGLLADDSNYAVNSCCSFWIKVQGRTLTAQAEINTVLNTVLAKPAQTGQEFQNNEAVWRAIMWASEILRRSRGGEVPSELLHQATTSLQLAATRLPPTCENLRMKLFRAANRHEDLRAAGALTIDSIFQEWNQAFSAAETDEATQEDGPAPAMVLHVQDRDSDFGQPGYHGITTRGNYRDGARLADSPSPDPNAVRRSGERAAPQVQGNLKEERGYLR